jgi:propanol-preferring alcohol dehydrogenase
MKAMLLQGVEDLSRNHSPLEFTDIPKPTPEKGEVLIKIWVCGVCHTELDEIEGRTLPENYPVVPGHQVVGTVEEIGNDVDQFNKGDRVGVAWIYSACGKCYLCKAGEENLCEQFTATGRDKNGGYAEYMTVPADFAYPIPDELKDEEAAPLLCAGAIGYRSLSLTNISDGKRLGLTGFGASGHLMLRMAKYLYPNSDVFVFARNKNEREFALELGAVWAGVTDDTAPEKLHAIIDTTPVWKPDVEALRNLAPGGRLVINAIRKQDSDIDYLQKIDYSTHLWMEKEIKSVANVTRKDVQMMLKIAAEAGIRPDVQLFPLDKANEALMEIKEGNIKGGKVLRINE